MSYWRKENFQGLSALVRALADDPDLAEFVQYLRLREQGLRKSAFLHLDRFTTAARTLPLDRRCDLVNRLMHLQHERPLVHDILPTPIYRDLINPTLDEWITVEPTNPVPFRWRAGNDNLRRAVTLDPNEDIARGMLIHRLLCEVEMAVHELPWGYIGPPQEDSEKLDEVRKLLQGWTTEKGQPFLQRLNSLSTKVQSYIEYQNSGSTKSFHEWLENQPSTGH